MHQMRSSRSPIPRLVIYLSALLFVYGFYLGGLQYAITEIAAEFSLDIDFMGMLVSIQYLSTAITPVFMGIAADKYGKKRNLIIAIFLFFSGCMIAGFSRSPLVYIFGSILIGAGYSVCESLCSAIVSDFDPAYSSRYVNLTQLFLTLGAVISPIVLREVSLPSQQHWRFLFFSCALFLILSALTIIPVKFPISARERKSHVDFRFLCSPVFMCLFFGMVIYVGLENGYGYFVRAFFQEQYHESNLDALSISAYWLGMSISRFYFSISNSRSTRTLIYAFFSICILFMGLLLSEHVLPSICLCFCIGAAYGPIWSMLMSSAANAYPDCKASIIGVMSAGCGLGGIIYPILMSLIAANSNLSLSFIALSTSALLGGLICILFQHLSTG